MIRYLINKMLCDRKESITNMIFTSCLMAVLTVCFHIFVRIERLVHNDWYKNSLEIASIQDPFIREKMGVILYMILGLSGMICFFCLVLYVLKLKLDMIKESRQIAVFQVLGYTQWRRTGALYVGKLMELSIALVFGSMFAYGIWKCLCGQKTFFALMTMMNENVKFEWMYVCISFILLAIVTVFVIFWVIKKKIRTIDILKGAE